MRDGGFRLVSLIPAGLISIREYGSILQRIGHDIQEQRYTFANLNEARRQVLCITLLQSQSSLLVLRGVDQCNTASGEDVVRYGQYRSIQENIDVGNYEVRRMEQFGEQNAQSIFTNIVGAVCDDNGFLGR